MATDKAARRPRADGLRNRERLLDAAREAFAAGEDSIALDEIARRAGVGVGTVYRHFPTRDVLIEALYRAQVEALAREADRLAAELPPFEALRQWMLLFVDYTVSKRLLASALEAVVGPGAGIFAKSSECIMKAVRDLSARAAEVGAFDPAVDPVDLLRALSGVLNISAPTDAGERARRLVDIMLAGAAPATRNA